MPRATALLLARSTHPEAVGAMTVLTTLLALASGRGAGTIWVFAAVLTGQLFVGWTNDLVDADLDRRQGRTDKPLAAAALDRRLVAAAAALALLLCIPLSLASGLPATLVHLAGVAAATAYNLGLKATPASLLPYAVAFALLPNFVSLGLPTHRLAPLWATTASALVGVAAHFMQTLPDIGRDREVGLRGLPHLLGSKGSALVATASLLAAAILVTLRPGTQSRPGLLNLLALAAVAGVDLAVLAAAQRGRTLTAFRLTIGSAVLVVGAFVAGGASLGSG